MRVVQNDKALEEGNPDDILTVLFITHQKSIVKSYNKWI